MKKSFNSKKQHKSTFSKKPHTINKSKPNGRGGAKRFKSANDKPSRFNSKGKQERTKFTPQQKAPEPKLTHKEHNKIARDKFKEQSKLGKIII